jgi:hypothetical protein
MKLKVRCSKPLNAVVGRRPPERITHSSFVSNFSILFRRVTRNRHSRHDAVDLTHTMTASSERQSTPLSLSGKTPEPDPAVKKPKNRKPSKKPIPHSATLHGLWGKSKSTDERSETSIDDAKTDVSEVGGNVEGATKIGKLLVFRIAPAKLTGVLASARPPDRMITPPRSLPDVTPETPVQLEHSSPKSSRSGGKKRAHRQTPSEAVRRSPRNHPLSTVPSIQKPVTKPHPFFLGKAARMHIV